MQNSEVSLESKGKSVDGWFKSKKTYHLNFIKSKNDEGK